MATNTEVKEFEKWFNSQSREEKEVFKKYIKLVLEGRDKKDAIIEAEAVTLVGL